MIVEFFDNFDVARLEEALAVRARVFVDEQGVPLELEIDDFDHLDPRTRHALVRDGSMAVGTGRFYAAGEQTAQIGRMAVLPEWRGRGVGGALLRALMEEATRRGYTRARLLAQTHALEFYRRAGFVEDGELVLDAGILHRPMSRILSGNT